jgi:hypothetical protein
MPGLAIISIPEPGSLALAAVGLCCLVAPRRRRPGKPIR